MGSTKPLLILGTATAVLAWVVLLDFDRSWGYNAAVVGLGVFAIAIPTAALLHLRREHPDQTEAGEPESSWGAAYYALEVVTLVFTLAWLASVLAGS